MSIKPTSLYQLSTILGLVSSPLTKIIKFAKQVLRQTHNHLTHDQRCVEIHIVKEQNELRSLKRIFFPPKWHNCEFHVFMLINRI